MTEIRDATRDAVRYRYLRTLAQCRDMGDDNKGRWYLSTWYLGRKDFASFDEAIDEEMRRVDYEATESQNAIARLTKTTINTENLHD